MFSMSFKMMVRAFGWTMWLFLTNGIGDMKSMMSNELSVLETMLSASKFMK